MSGSRSAGFPAPAPAEFLHDFLLAPAAGPERGETAVLDPAAASGPRPVSFAGLATLAREYAAALSELRPAIGDRVILESDTCAPAIAMVIACSLLGLTFVPVSPRTPAERLAAIITSARPWLCLRHASGPQDQAGLTAGAGWFDAGGLRITRQPPPRPRLRSSLVPTDPAYIVFTSGTTGRPKGVVMSHRAILAFFRGMTRHAIVAPRARVASCSPFQFDFALLDIGLALGSAAAVVPVPQRLLWQPRKFVSYLRDAEVTQVNGVPAIWRPVLHHAPAELSGLDTLAGVLYSGEEFPLAHLRELRRLRPGLRIVNCFGSTESVAWSFTDVPDPIPAGVTQLPIGPAHAGAEVTLIDDAGRAVTEPGRVGEIYLRGSALFSGYWDDPEASARALVPDPLNKMSGQVVFRTGDLACRGDGGELFFRGRNDSMVKIRGNRVELGEVERALRGLPGVTGAVVLALPAANGEPGLTAFLVMAAGAARPGEHELIAHCQRSLPGYMVPERFAIIPRLPVTPNGKTDRAALAESLRPALP